MLNNPAESERLGTEIPDAEKAREQLEADAVLLEKEKQVTQPGRLFDRGPSPVLADKLPEMLGSRTVVEGSQSEKAKAPENADKSSEFYNFIKRFEVSKSLAESIAIMNEVLMASQSGKIPPNEATELLNQEEKLDQSKAA